MANILCIETASTNCSVALGLNGKLIGLKEDYESNYSHAERLHVFIRDLLAENNIDLSLLDAVAISKGPGSYTGLRIGVSAAKGLCFTLDIPLISVSTLTALAYQVEEEVMVIPMQQHDILHSRLKTHISYLLSLPFTVNFYRFLRADVVFTVKFLILHLSLKN